jgi:predicted nuclease of restriction endonuclease-like (RecB) superfamily
MMAKRGKTTEIIVPQAGGYGELVAGISELLDRARRTAVRSVNGILTAAYWEIGRRIVEYEQGGSVRAEYGEGLLKRLAADLTKKHGRGFSRVNLQQMRLLYLGWEIFQTASGRFEACVRLPAEGDSAARPLSPASICQTPSDKSLSETSDESGSPAPAKKRQTPSDKSKAIGSSATAPASFPSEGVLVAFPGTRIDFAPDSVLALANVFPLSWSQYVRLMSVDKPHARAFYEAESIRGGWSVRQLDRQISTQFFERTSHTKRQAAMLARGQKARPEDAVSVQDEIRDPYLLEFLDLKDEYSESELEDALIRHLEWFLLELGTGFTFVARQKRIRIGHVWYRIDLLLYHRGLRCLVVIDLSRGPFTHADAGQMNLYLNYVKEHLTLPDEADPVGIILCSDKHDAVVKYALGGINGPATEQLDPFVLICYDFEGVIMELFVLCKDARQWSGLLQRSSIDSGL